MLISADLLTADALWLNSFFEGYDRAILSFANKMAELLGVVLTPLNKLITLLGEKGLIFFLLAVVLMLIPRFRKTGVCVFGAVCCGALITNIILKDHIARPRPFETYELYRQWWEFVGAPMEDGFSFPSGHVTAAAAGMTALSLMRGKKWVIPGVVWVLLMMFSRNYLMAHYPSDVLFALFIGIFSGFVAALITQLIFRFLESRRGEGAFWDFLLEGGIRLPSRRGEEADFDEEEPPVRKASRREKADRAEKPAASEKRGAYEKAARTGGTAERRERTAAVPQRRERPATQEAPARTERAGSHVGSHASSERSSRSRQSSDTYIPKH